MLAITGYDMSINSSSFRMIIVTSYVTTTVLLAAYSAALISFMTVQTVTLPFTTFEGLLQHDEYRLAVEQGTAHISFFNVRTAVPSRPGRSRPTPLLLRHYLIATNSSSLDDHQSILSKYVRYSVRAGPSGRAV